MEQSGLIALALALAILAGVVFLRRQRRTGSHGHTATFDVLHAANQAAPLLRAGFNAEQLDRAAPFLRSMLGSPAVAVVGPAGLLAYAGVEHHHDDATAPGSRTLQSGESSVDDLGCAQENCVVRHAVSVPVSHGDEVIGALVAFDATADPLLIRSMTEVASWITGQVELAQFDEHRARLARAELRALRAQISPHFIYNALTAIAAFTRSDPERARELLLEFADFTRYSLSSHGEFTTLGDELRSIERYLSLEQARFGERLHVRLTVAPEVLPVAIPFLVLQPLVENAVRHGIEGRSSAGLLEINAIESSTSCVVTIEDNGVGADPSMLQALLDHQDDSSEHIGLVNVDERLRSVYGPAFGLQIETAPGAGTKVTVRFPKYRPGVRA